MSRVNAFLKAGNENRDVSVGGRGRNNSVWADLNTDNSEQSDCCLRAKVIVRGAHDNKKGIDERTSHFSVTLPDDGKAVSVKINVDSENKRSKYLSSISTFLSSLAAQWNLFKVEEPFCKTTSDVARELSMLRQKYEELPDIVLPGQVKLDYALACVRICEELFPRE